MFFPIFPSSFTEHLKALPLPQGDEGGGKEVEWCQAPGDPTQLMGSPLLSVKVLFPEQDGVLA